MSALSDLLATQPLSARDASKKAEDRGIRLPAGTIASYWSGRHGRPSPQTLERLSQVIDIPLAKLQEAAWGTSAPLGDYVPPAEAALLDERQRRAIDELIRSMVTDRSRHRADIVLPLAEGVEVALDLKTTTGSRELVLETVARIRREFGLPDKGPEGLSFGGVNAGELLDRQADYDLARRQGAGKSRGQQIRDEHDRDAGEEEGR